jgi:GNAT superfamily N-acetyltransferase
MNPSYRELRQFHIGAQTGVFIDEVIAAPGGAGVLVFSRREAEPMWNTLFVDDPVAAQAAWPSIVRLFAARNRRPVWYLTEEGTGLLDRPARPLVGCAWMVRPRGVESPWRSARRLVPQPVETAAQAARFNQLYVEIFWNDQPPVDVALPIPDGEPAAPGGGPQETLHWILADAGDPVAILTTIRRGRMCGVYNVGTRPRLTGRGYASQAILGALDSLEARGCDGSFLLTEDETLPPFYERLGYETVAAGRFYTGVEE